MNARKQLCAFLLALIPLCSLTLPTMAFAQTYRSDSSYGPVIRGFNVDEVPRVAPGVELNFDLYGTPGGIATLHIDGAARTLRMTETEPGRYEGIYTISNRDRVSPNSPVTANLRVGNRVATTVLSESLLRGVGPARAAHPSGELALAPRIERFTVRGANDLMSGSELTFTVFGTPDAKVELTIQGARGVFFLPEVRPGEYSGVYTVRPGDRILPDSRATATLRKDGRVSTSVLGSSLLAHGRAERQQVARYCTNCAVVEAVNVVDVSGDGSYLGTIGGAVLGGLLGNQVGSGSGRTAASVAGAIGGAVAGRQIERNMHHQQRYEVVVRYNNGATQTLTYENDPGFRPGDRVRVNDGVLTRDR